MPDIIATIPRPPICIIIRMITCPKTLHVLNVGSVTSPVTHIDVVAVKRASMYCTAVPSDVLIGNERSRLPINTAIRKLSIIICVVEISNFTFFNLIPPLYFL